MQALKTVDDKELYDYLCAAKSEKYLDEVISSLEDY